MIGIRDLVFEYPGHRALDGVSLAVEQGAITALVGAPLFLVLLRGRSRQS